MLIPVTYEFFSQSKINAGKKALEHIPCELESMDARKPIVLTSREITSSGLTAAFKKALYESDIVLGAVYDRVYPYATINQINDLALLFRERGCDSIIALGGGSIMNVAKGLNIAVSLNGHLTDCAGEDKISSHLKPLIYVATGSVNGKETTSQAYVDNHKFVSTFLLPDVVIIDNRMVRSLDPQSAVDSSLAALTAAIESCAYPYNNPMSDLYANVAIKLIFNNLPRVIKKPRDREACRALANAHAVAGIAFSNVPEGMAFSLGRAIAHDTSYSMGACMGVLLFANLSFKMEKGEGIRSELLYALRGIDEYCATPERDRVRRSMELLGELYGAIGEMIPRSLKEMRIPRYRLAEYAREAAHTHNKRLNYRDCLALLERAWEGVNK